MKNKIIIFLIYIFFYTQSVAENLNIQSLNMTVDKKTQITIFQNQVSAKDEKNNQLLTEFAEYDQNLQSLKTTGKSTVITSEGYFINGENFVFDNTKNIITSADSATIKDLENNEIYLENFEYSTKDNLFQSVGKIKVIDSKQNIYNFTQIYIDEKKREIVGTDAKTFLNEDTFKVDKRNKPRIFSNTVNIYDQGTSFTKSVFTLCDYRKNDKCPPWSLQAKKMFHDKKKKTIYYDNAVIKIYDLPIFFLPKLSHPDPTVDRRSGFLIPTFTNSKNMGFSADIPYFLALNKDKDLTIRNKLFSEENPLFWGEYRQAFKESDLIADFGYSSGYKKTSAKKKPGDKSHFFSKFVKNFKGKNDSDNSFALQVQQVSDDKYLKLYKIKSNLVDYEQSNLENSLSFTSEEDYFFAFKASAHETLVEGHNDKYQYILPSIIYDKNLFASNTYGILDLTSNLNVHNYDTNKYTKFLVNDFDWKFKTNNFKSGLKGNWLGTLKNVNYENKNTAEFKEEPSNELFGALGYLTKIDLFKKNNDDNFLLTPKILVRYAPGMMRNATEKLKIDSQNIFSLDRLSSYNNFESGLSSTLGFDYEFKNNEKQLNFSVGQIINEKENKKMASSSSLDQKTSDLVGSVNYKANNELDFNYNFNLDHNYNELNYNDVGLGYDLKPIKFNINYLQEKKHIGNKEYFTTNMQYSKGNNGLFAFELKRNIITDSNEFYNLSYEYLNDCLRAGLVYRREFYNDSELEAENSLMFKVTLMPFGAANSNNTAK